MTHLPSSRHRHSPILEATYLGVEYLNNWQCWLWPETTKCPEHIFPALFDPITFLPQIGGAALEYDKHERGCIPKHCIQTSAKTNIFAP